MDQKFKNLRKYNLLMSILHAGQAIAMLMLSTTFTLPINTSYVEFNVQTFKLEAVLENLINIPVAPLIAIFLLLSSLAHLLVSVPGIFEWYVSNLKKEINFARWYEYALSSSLMIVVIAMLAGVYDLGALILMFGINAMMILFGLMMELHNQTTEKTNWTSFIFGCVAGVLPWVVIGLHLFNAGEGDNKAPDFVYWIFFSIFLFFNSFAVNMILQYKKVGKWRDYIWGEQAYILLSLVAKSLLAWQVWAGTLRPV